MLLTAAVQFPSCWDGLLNNHAADGNTADFTGARSTGVVNHLAYVQEERCPAGFGRHLPTLRVNISWNYAGDGRDVQLSSGPGYTLHGDFFNTWKPTGLQDMVRTCINTSLTEIQVHERFPGICGPPIVVPATHQARAS